jgi:tight adherence protein C
MFLFSAMCIAWQVVKTAQRITYVTLADGRRQERSLSLIIRLMLPFASSVPGFIVNHRLLKPSRENLSRKLIAGGFEGLIEPEEIIGLRVMTPLVMGFISCFLLRLSLINMTGMLGQFLSTRQGVICAVLVVFYAFYPDYWLKKAVKQRHRHIERALPFVLDLLTLAVESGLDFMSGIKRIIEYRKIDPLGEELIRVFREIQIGRTRREALTAMARRIDHIDIRAITNALIQADELGTGIGGALRIQSDQIRTKRFQRAERLGNEAPVKMLFPLVAFIFPAVFIVLLGPVIIQMMAGGGF